MPVPIGVAKVRQPRRYQILNAEAWTCGPCFWSIKMKSFLPRDTYSIFATIGSI